MKVHGLAVVSAATALVSCGGLQRAGAPAATCAPLPSPRGMDGVYDRSFALAPLPLCAAGLTRGPADPHALDPAALIPRGRVRHVWFLHGGRRADQVIVVWTDRERAAGA